MRLEVLTAQERTQPDYADVTSIGFFPDGKQILTRCSYEEPGRCFIKDQFQLGVEDRDCSAAVEQVSCWESHHREPICECR
jgi:hypothetical protein